MQFPGPHYETPAEIRHGPRHRRPPRRHEHDARGDRRPRGRDGGPRHQPGHQPRRRHERRAAQPRGGPRGGHAPRPAGWATCSARSSRGSDDDARPGHRRRRQHRPGRSPSAWPTAATRWSASTWSRSPRATTAPGTPSTAPTPTPSPRSFARGAARRRRAPRRHPRRGVAPRRAHLPRRHDRRAARRDGRARRTPHRLRLLQPRGRPHARAPTCSAPTGPPRPDTFYGVAKVAAEALLHLYVDRYGIDAVACRIGSFLERPATRPQPVDVALPRRLRADGRGRADRPRARLRRPLRHLAPTPARWWDLEPGRAAGLRPAGRRRGVRRRVEPGPSTTTRRPSHVGGPFATGAVRPARPATLDLERTPSATLVR